MRIRRIDAEAVLAPMPFPVRTASGTVDVAPLVLITLHTDAGVAGHAYLFTYAAGALAPTRDLVAWLAAQIEGQPCDPLALKNLLESRLRLLGTKGLVGMALAGIDMAAWDACARSARVPLAQWLGALHDEVPAYFSQGLDDAAASASTAAQAFERGFRAVKIRLGHPTLAEDLAVVEAVCSAIGGGGKGGLMVDYNQSLSPAEALRRCRALESFGLAWIEEPLPHDDDDGHAALAAAIATPIQLGENWFGLREMQQSMAAGAADLAMPDLMKIGGVTGWLQAARLAERHARPMSSHLFTEASAHVLAASPTAHWLEVLDVAHAVRQGPLPVRGGRVRVADLAPGSGLEWDRAAVERYRV